MDPTPIQTQPPQTSPPEAPKTTLFHHLTSRNAFIWMALITILLAGETVFLYIKNLQLESALTSQSQPVPTPVINPPSPTPDPMANWKSITVSTDSQLHLANYQVKIPPSWVRIEHSSSFQNKETFQDSYTNSVFQVIINQDTNINSQTGKPYSTLREFTQLNYDVQTVMVAGQTAAQVLPRAGSETNFMVLFFSPNNAQTFSVELDTPRDATHVQEGKTLFDQILSTFKFTNTSENTVLGIQTNTCCSCPTYIPASQIGTNGWVIYEKGKNYSSQLPTQCKAVQCAPCPPLPPMLPTASPL